MARADNDMVHAPASLFQMKCQKYPLRRWPRVLENGYECGSTEKYSENLTVMQSQLWFSASWDVTRHRLAVAYRRFRITCRCHLQWSFGPISKFVLNISVTLLVKLKGAIIPTFSTIRPLRPHTYATLQFVVNLTAEQQPAISTSCRLTEQLIVRGYQTCTNGAVREILKGL